MSAPKVIVSGIMFWFPLAGVTFQFLHYLLGLRRLGFDPYYVEDSSRWLYNPRLRELSCDPTENLAAVVPVLEEYGFRDRWAFRGRYSGGSCHGLSEGRLAELYREADVFLNVCGAQEILDEHFRIKRRIYVETDPVAAQVRVVQGDAKMIAMLDAHHTHFSFGENFYSPDCKVPLVKYKWKRTRQPVVLDMWADAVGPGEAYTTVATWANKGKDIVWEGETYHWSKDREYKKFLELPQRRPVTFGVALEDDGQGRELMKRHGWRCWEAAEVSQKLETYKMFIQGARGEFTVAKDQNIRLRSGWFSDRSACYLASGRPVITQETGFSKVLPTGEGLFGFETMEDILRAVDRIETDYERARRAAREIAHEYFDAERVLRALFEECA